MSKKNSGCIGTIPGMSSAQVARELGVTTTYVRLLLSEGKLSYSHTALGRLIDEESVAAFQAERIKKSEKPGWQGRKP